MIAAVVIERYLYFRLYELTHTWEMELEILDVESPLYPHRLIVGTDAENLLRFIIQSIRVIEIGSAEKKRKMVVFYQKGCVGEEEIGVGLEMDEATINKEMAITFEKPGAGEPFAWILHLRVTEGEPYLAHLVPVEEPVYDFYVSPEESHISKSLFEGLGSSSPHSCAFDIDSYEVHVRI